MLGYHPHNQELVVAADSINIPMTIALRPKTTELQNVEIRVIQPIIVKQDTIIYNVGHWTQATDRTLEEVLARIPGFKIRGDGELSLNGKPIDKVVIDGKEVSDGGAALITRSISPENIKEIQVRLDEKDAELKESLIDTRKLVVLDIRLRDDVNKSFFGLARGSIGHQQTTRPGGYGNVFSLRKKTNAHVFAEHDQFGEQTISLDQIKNIGQEAFQKIFDVPADFNEVSEKQDFNREIYGFKDYTQSTNNVLGATGHHRISDGLQLFVGSYNSYQKLARQRDYQQLFFEGLETGFGEINSLRNFSSKNKVELRYDQSKIKARADVNAVYLFDRNNTTNTAVPSINYEFSDQLRAFNLYQNAFVEYLPGGAWAFRLKTAFAKRNSNDVRKLNHNDVTYGRIIINQALDQVFNFQQQIGNRQTSWHSEAGAFFKKKWGQTSFQFRHEFQGLTNEKQGSDLNLEGAVANVPNFSLPITHRQFQKFGPGVGQTLILGNLQLGGEFFYMNSTFPTQDGSLQSLQLPEYNVSLDYNPGNMNHFTLSWVRRISTFSLHKVMAGFSLRDFQNASVLGPVNLSPQPEDVWQLWTGKNFNSINLLIDPTILVGQTRTSDRIILGTSLPVSILYDQLATRYIAISVPFTKNFQRIPLQLVLEPEMINSFQENIDPDGRSYTTGTKRHLLGLKINSDFETRKIHFLIYPKYSAFRFSSEITPASSIQHMTSLESSVGWLITKQFSANTTWRHVVFTGTADSRFTNGSLQLRYSGKKIVAWLEADNLLNNTLFVRQSIFPNVFVNNSELVFGRYVKVGVDFKFR
jgi:hypothetical protein